MVTFAPGDLGDRFADLVVVDSATDRPLDVTLTGTGVGQPDLVPRLDFNAAVPTIVVENRGSVDAGPSTTVAALSTGGIRRIPTPAIPAGQRQELPLDVPDECRASPGCQVGVMADGDDVAESDEANNEVRGPIPAQ
jgi:hypothetical protein